MTGDNKTTVNIIAHNLRHAGFSQIRSHFILSLVILYIMKYNSAFPPWVKEGLHPIFLGTPIVHQQAQDLLSHIDVIPQLLELSRHSPKMTRYDGDSVPRGARRSTLHDSGCIANMVDFKSSWSEETVRAHIDHLFKGIIYTSKPYPRLGRL